MFGEAQKVVRPVPVSHLDPEQIDRRHGAHRRNALLQNGGRLQQRATLQMTEKSDRLGHRNDTDRENQMAEPPVGPAPEQAERPRDGEHIREKE